MLIHGVGEGINEALTFIKVRNKNGSFTRSPSEARHGPVRKFPRVIAKFKFTRKWNKKKKCYFLKHEQQKNRNYVFVNNCQEIFRTVLPRHTNFYFFAEYCTTRIISLVVV